MADQTYECRECGLHYQDEDTAKACYDFCSKYQACSIEITQYSIEHNEYKKSGLIKGEE